MICITGDMHGDISRFNDKKINSLKRGDILLVCGDFGFVWDGSKQEDKVLRAIGKKKFYTLFVEGCHDNYDLLAEYPEEEFCGGKVNVISGNLMRLQRGNVFELQGYKFFAFGGGQTKEIDIRKESKKWWEAEIPNTEEIRDAVLTLNRNGNAIDYIITHEPPATMKEFLGFDVRQICHMHTFFDAVKNDCTFKMWFFGKAHVNKLIPPRYQCLFDSVVTFKNDEWDKQQKLLKKLKRKKNKPVKNENIE